jgi:hypothetical protein
MTMTEDRIDLNGSRNTSHFENESWIEKPWKKFEIVVFRLQRVLVQWKSEFWPAVLSWLLGVVTTSVWEDEAPTAAHRHGNIKTMRPALVKELPYGIPP